MSQQEPLNVVSLRTGIIITIILVLVVAVGLIFYNLFKTMGSMHTENAKQETKVSQASERDTSWYQNQFIQKPVISEKNTLDKKPIMERHNAEISTQQQPQQSEKDLIEAMKAPITSNELTPQQRNDDRGQIVQSATDGLTTGLTAEQRNDPNMQFEKSSFIANNQKNDDEYLHSMIKNPLSPYELQAGAIIPGVLVTGINSDLPGEITGQVKSNVYDSISGKYVLIPQGAKLQGVYDSSVAYGQERVLIVWKRIIYPNGQSLNLEGMSGVDMSGYSGFSDQVNSHYGKLLSSVLLMSVLSSGAQLSQPQQSNNSFAAPSVSQTLAQSLGTNIANVGTMMTSKSLNIQPTIEIRQGYEFNISVKKDIVFLRPYDA